MSSLMTIESAIRKRMASCLYGMVISVQVRRKRLHIDQRH